MQNRAPSWKVSLAAMLVVAAASVAEAAGPAITLQSLLGEMVDRDAAARFPDPAYTCRQASSYDRASTSPDDPTTWWANGDNSFYLRSEKVDGREEFVMMDVDGPGAIVRWWITGSNLCGNIRIYIDGQKEPVINQRADRLIGGDALVGPPLSEVTARGYNLYLPIPYAKHCKVTYDRKDFRVTHDRDDMLYYQINYRTYPAGTQVESFSSEKLAAAKEQIERVQELLYEPAVAADMAIIPPRGSSQRPVRLVTIGSEEAVPIAPGKSVEWSSRGPGAIGYLLVRLTAKDKTAALRATVLSIEFDGQQTVSCPVGDFFGGGVGVNPYRDWKNQVSKDGRMDCLWVMPFAESARIVLKNYGDEQVEAVCVAMSFPWTWDDRSMHFHCNWRLQQPIDASKKFDWNYVSIEGRGVYMGDSLALFNPVPIWWGEGDEKVYVDGEKFPSHFGTGTEDYYGYAWGTPDFFQSPFHAQPRADGPGNQGHITNTRVRLLDGIPFTRSLKFDMEVWHWRPVPVVYAATTWWYGAPGAKGNHGPTPETAQVFATEVPKPPAVEGAIEGEGLKILEKTGGTTQIQEIPHLNWSDWKQVWWIDAKVGERLVLAVPVAKAGKFKLSANLTKAVDYAVAQFSLDGRPLGEPIDLFNNGVISQVYPLGTHELTAGEHRLTVEIMGANAKAIPRHMVGIDYLKLEPQ